MREKAFYLRIFLTLGTASLLLSGCNVYSGMHQDGKESNATVLVADGQAALERGDYNNAANYFTTAMQNDPASSEARVGYARAYLKVRGFNLSNFLDTLVTNQNTGTTGLVLVKPADWGCRDYTELTALFTSMINVLDPIALGLTHGPIASTDPTTNLDIGFFYVLRMAARSQQLVSTLQVLQFKKGSTETAALLASDPYLPTVYAALPETFYWITNSPSLLLLAQLRSDANTGITRLRTASANMGQSARKTIDDLIRMFESLQTQVNQ
jgi:hypothetical protein